MKLIFIYGPPAAGKLTVAKELSKLTGYNIFHNHLSNDLVACVFKFGTPEFFKVSGEYRMDIFRRAAKAKITGLIFTMCYAYKKDDSFVKSVISAVAKNGGKVEFVQLICHKSELKKRVKSESRKRFRKVKTIKKLNTILKGSDLYSPIPFVKSLSIDNTCISPKNAALRIKEFYKL